MNPLQEIFFEKCDRIDDRYQSAVIIAATTILNFARIEGGARSAKIILEQTAKLVNETPQKLVIDATNVLNAYLDEEDEHQ